MSRTIRGLSLVHVETAERVLKIADELGYMPHEGARSLRMKRSMTVGVLFPDLASPIQVGHLDGLFDVLQSGGYTPLVTLSRNDPAEARVLLRKLMERRVDAVVLHTPIGIGSVATELMATGVPVIASGSRGEDCREIPLVSFSAQAALAEALTEIEALGHRRVGVVWSAIAATSLMAGELAAELDSRGLEWVSDQFDRGGGEQDRLLSSLDRVLSDPIRPTFLFVPHRNLHVLLTELDRRGLRVPQDVSISTLARFEPYESHMRMQIASLEFDALAVGREVGTRLLAWIDGVPPPNTVGLNVTHWNARESIGPAPQRGSAE